MLRIFQLIVKMSLLHDGIWFTCPDERVIVARFIEALKKSMENSVRLSIPLKVEMG